MTSTAPSWYVVQSQPNAEAKAAANLERQGFGIYLPRYRKRRRHARKTEIVAAPLFPGYLFVKLDLATHQWRPIMSTIGVKRIVCGGDQPVPLTSKVIDVIKAGEGADGFIQMPSAFRSGDRVRILDGVFAGALALYLSMTDSERVAVLLDLLGRKVRVTLNPESVSAA